MNSLKPPRQAAVVTIVNAAMTIARDVVVVAAVDEATVVADVNDPAAVTIATDSRCPNPNPQDRDLGS